MSQVKFVPLSDHILVQAVEAEKVTASGIIIPDTASKEKPQKGKVLAVGNGKMNSEGKVLPMNVKVGDEVIFTKYAPTEIKIDGVEYLVLEEKDILGIVQ
jgi:chaperonin GroES